MTNSIRKHIKFDGIQNLNSGKYVDGKWVLGPNHECRRYELGMTFNTKDTLLTFKEITEKGFFEGYKIPEGHEPSLTFKHLEGTPLPFMNIDFIPTIMKDPIFLDSVIDVIDSIKNIYVEGILWTETVKMKTETVKMKKENNLSNHSWRKQIIKEDTVCVACGGNKHLEAHHVFSQADYPEFSGHPGNGVPLCKFCHKKYHSYYPGEANPINLIEFLKRFGDLE